ncbi:efflux protein, MATE family [Salinarchaeum sp. Harcht-Bsk1]|uniref:MATE family efflux transporter n=1 Tax=Salinarchaeum sp. Harcht-Bsk1 TaxID=1333523 RepID=UPI000342430E|nr:MATE family efflux transporter [Salinarchaeum sp. Harcht-Bsk1]AGN01457.1 efflux protein, MATE family [Salinarchaeum sp. Harcht-Bsk1]
MSDGDESSPAEPTGGTDGDDVIDAEETTNADEVTDAEPADRTGGDGATESEAADRTDADEQAERFTEGTLVWPLLTLAGPLVATQILQTLYNLADAFWVGQVSADAITAVSFAWPIVFLLISVGGGMTAAGTILVSQYTGARDDEAVGHVAGQTLGFVALLSLGISIVGIVSAPHLITLLGADPDGAVHAMATDYTRVTFLGLWAMFGFFVFQALLRGWGDTKTPMYLTIGSVGLNLVLDPFFILGFADNPLLLWVGLGGLGETLHAATGFSGWGVVGAAVATILSRGLAAAVGMWLLFGDHVGITVALSDLRPEFASVRKIVRVGAPISVEQSTQALAITIMTALLGLVSADAVGGFGIANRVTTLVWFPLVGMGMAVETVAGQNVGAGRPDRAKRVVLYASAILVAAFVVVGAVIAVYAAPITGLFVTGDDAAIVGHGADYLRWVAPTYAIMAIFHMINGGLHGAGATRLSMGLGLFALWGAQTVIAAVLIVWVGMGATGAWIGVAAANVIAALAGTAVFAWGGWLDSVVDADPEANADPEQAGTGATAEPAE